MSQRGGSVVTYVKYGDKVYSPIVDKGEADIILAFELLEAYRALPYLKKGGKTFADCKQCGLCEKKCPQHLEIRKNLEKVCEILCKAEK